MPWTEITRLQYRREGLRFATDTTDGEWMFLELTVSMPAEGCGAAALDRTMVALAPDVIVAIGGTSVEALHRPIWCATMIAPIDRHSRIECGRWGFATARSHRGRPGRTHMLSA